MQKSAISRENASKIGYNRFISVVPDLVLPSLTLTFFDFCDTMEARMRKVGLPMLISDYIAQMLRQMLEEQNGTLELQRNDMAQKLGCAPSQINYVITSRFTPRHGYVVESRRGGGGYIRIVKKELHKDAYLMHFFHAVGESLTEAEAFAMIRNLCAQQVFDTKVGASLLAATSDTALMALEQKQTRDRVRADILRQLILSQME